MNYFFLTVISFNNRMTRFKKYFCYHLGKLLCVFSLLWSFSSSRQRSIILLENYKSNSSNFTDCTIMARTINKTLFHMKRSLFSEHSESLFSTCTKIKGVGVGVGCECELSLPDSCPPPTPTPTLIHPTPTCPHHRHLEYFF